MSPVAIIHLRHPMPSAHLLAAVLAGVRRGPRWAIDISNKKEYLSRSIRTLQRIRHINMWEKENASASAPNVPDVDLDGWMEELERAVNEWNTEVAVQRDDSWVKDVDGSGNDECGS